MIPVNPYASDAPSRSEPYVVEMLVILGTIQERFKERRGQFNGQLQVSASSFDILPTTLNFRNADMIKACSWESKHRYRIAFRKTPESIPSRGVRFWLAAS